MNYIAHLHIAQHTGTSLLGNFLGDFVKGNDLSHLPISLQRGVRLHRWVDKTTDQHPSVKQLVNEFPTSLKRFAPIAVDIAFDHLLVRHWHTVEREYSFEELTTNFYAALANHAQDHGERFTQVKTGLIEHRWLQDYQHPSSMLNALKSIEKRLRFRRCFAHACYQHIVVNQSAFEDRFLAFYPTLLHQAQQQACRLTTPIR